MTTPTAGQPGGASPSPERGRQLPDLPQGGRVSGRLRQFAWASMPIWSLSLLAYLPFLRIALARHRARDWAVFTGYLAAVVLEVVLASIAGPDDAASVAAGSLAVTVAGFAAVHAFVAFSPGRQAGANARASELALTAARARVHRRQQARELAEHNPVLARELGIGRPDVPHDYDDGGLVDVNQVPGDALASSLGFTPAESAAVISARERLGRFSSVEELSVYAQLPLGRVEAVRDLLLFG